MSQTNVTECVASPNHSSQEVESSETTYFAKWFDYLTENPVDCITNCGLHANRFDSDEELDLYLGCEVKKTPSISISRENTIQKTNQSINAYSNLSQRNTNANHSLVNSTGSLAQTYQKQSQQMVCLVGNYVQPVSQNYNTIPWAVFPNQIPLQTNVFPYNAVASTWTVPVNVGHTMLVE